MKKALIVSTLIALGISIAPAIASADTGCDGIYGGGTNCGTNGFILKKQVADPKNTSKFVDNLGTNDAHYHPGNLIFFKLTVINNTTSDLTGVTLSDNLPRYVSYSSVTSSAGSFQTTNNAPSNTVTTNLNTVNKGQTITLTLTGIIANAQSVPANQTTCVVNQAQVNAANGQGTQASSQFCIDNTQSQPTQTPNQPTTKGGLPVQNQTQNQNPSYPVYTPSKNTKQTPKSGPEALPLLAMIPTGALGMWLRKKAK